MKTAVYPGSFDPVTKGHIDVLRRAASIFDKVIIAAAVNTNKKSLLTIDEKLEIIKECCKDIKNTEADSFDGLTIEYAKKRNADVIIRGLRAVSDFEYELQLSQANSTLCPDIQTVFLLTKPECSFISSGTVREILQMGGDISKFVPEPAVKFLEAKFKNNYMRG